MQNDIARALALLFEPGQVVELRALFGDATASGYYDDMARLAADAEVVEAAQPQGMYVTLNEVNPALLARRENRTKMRLGKKDATTADVDILRRRWFPVDIDAKRPSGVSSTEAEHEAALMKAEQVDHFLSGEGWPDPILGDSGNGAHLLYRIDIPADQNGLELVKKGLEALSLMFDDDQSTIDIANHNASRIWKLYGTISRKGDSTEKRPHRRSLIAYVPDEFITVSNDQLERLAGALRCTAAASTAAPSKAGGQPIDLGRWLREHGVGVTDEKPYQGGTLFSLDECPFSGAHKDGSFAIQFPSGAIYAGCHHSSCGGGGQRWPELREKYDPKGSRKKTGMNRPPTPGIPPSPTPNPVDENVRIPHYDEAMTVLQHGDPLKAMLSTFALDHIGDEVPAECLIVSLASRSVENTKGLHVSVSGESGKGKSDTFDTILLQVPERFKLEGAMSNKFLFYMDDMQPGTAIVFDDKNLSEEMQEILKGATSSFKKPIKYRTVSKDRKAQVCSIPERCIWWVAKVEGSGDDQVFNRMLTCWIDDSAAQDEAVLVDMEKRAAKVPEAMKFTRPEVLTCQAMWEIIGRERIHVVIPYATRVEFQTKTNRRNPEIFLSLVKAHAVLFFMQRERFPMEDGGSYILATLDDFYAAARLFSLLNGTGGGQETKLTRRESELLTAVNQYEDVEFTIQQMQERTTLSYNAIYQVLHGYKSRGLTYSGLLDKCPAISFIDRTVVMDEETGRSVRRRTHAYQFNREMYRLWSSGGSVWLRPADPDERDGPSGDVAGNGRSAEGPAETISHGSGEEITNGLSYNNKYTLKSTNSGELQHTVSPKYAGACAVHSACECPTSAPNTVSEGFREPIVKQASQSPAISPGTVRNPAGIVPIARALDYKALDHAEYRAHCHVCGKKGVDYIEKLTPERKARKDKNAHRICKACYQASVRLEQSAIPILPGAIVASRMVPTTKKLGRCSLCNLEPVKWIDPGSPTHLCDFCHDRVAREESSREQANGGGSS